MNSTVMFEQSLTPIRTAFEDGKGHWTGCDWRTSFGTKGLNLEGLKASQALLLARATAGQEAADWRAAYKWLSQVEHDAIEAEALASHAVTLSCGGQLEEALERARQACRLEARYHPSSRWQSLCEVIEATLAVTRSNSL